MTVLGKSPAFADAGGACSGYLVQEGASTMLMDIGNGVFGKLRAAVDYATSTPSSSRHMHADHFLDLVPFAYALTYAPPARAGRAGQDRRPPPGLPPRGARPAPPHRRRLGRRGPHREGLRPRGVRERRRPRRRRRAHPHPRRPALPAAHERARAERAATRAAGASRTAPTTARPRGSSSSRRTPTCSWSRRRSRRPRSTARAATSRRARRASTAAGPVPAPRRHPRLGPHRPGLGAGRGGGRLRRPGRRSPPRATCTRSEPAARPTD